MRNIVSRNAISAPYELALFTARTAEEQREHVILSMTKQRDRTRVFTRVPFWPTTPPGFLRK
jgi:hypothetical protein